MLQLRLIEYTEKGNFVKILTKDFMYNRDYIYYAPDIINPTNKAYQTLGLVLLKDDKDPFNRFGGLFHGRTYENGQYVLEINHQDDVLKSLENHLYIRGLDFTRFDKLPVGNLHTEPKLFQEIKL